MADALAKWTIGTGRCGCCGRADMLCAQFAVPHHAVSILGRVPLCGICLSNAANTVDDALADLDANDRDDDVR